MKAEISSLWFTRLRLFAFIGQLLVLGAALFVFDLTLPWLEIVLLLLVIPASNLLAGTALIGRLTQTQVIGHLLALDTVLLTAVLYLAGGPTNPFTIVYLLHVVLAAVMLTTSWTWAIAGLTSLGFAALFLNYRPVPEWHSHGAHHGFSLHLHGMLLAYLTVALLVTYFLNKIVGDLRKKERAFERLKNTMINQRRLASLTTITAGAAHELGTPLGTIAVVSHELERAIAKRYPDEDLLDDIALLKQETARCKEVLQHLSEKTGDLLGEAPQSLSVSDLLHAAAEPLRFKVPLEIRGDTDFLMPSVPRRSLTMAVRAIIKNALEASHGIARPVQVVAAVDQQEVLLEIKDSGAGIDAESLERVGEPFFSTKEQDKGMGLGVYLARLTVEQLGGKLTIDSAPGQGTTAKITFPFDCSGLSKAA